MIVQKMIEVFQSLVSTHQRSIPRGSLPQPPESLMTTLQKRVARAGTSLEDGWEYDLEDFVYYLLSKRRIDKRIHQMLLTASEATTPHQFIDRIKERFPDMEFISKENVVDWYNNVICQNGEVIVKNNVAVMSVRHYIRVLSNLQNELVKSVRNSRSIRRRTPI